MPNQVAEKSSVAVSDEQQAAESNRRQPRINKWSLVKFYVFFLLICGGAVFLFDPTAVAFHNGKFQLLCGLLVLLLALLLALPSKPLPASKFNKVSRISKHRNRIMKAHQQKLDASKKRR